MNAIDRLEAQMKAMMTQILVRVLKDNGYEEQPADIVRMEIEDGKVTIEFQSATYIVDRKTEKVLDYQPAGGFH